MAKDAVSGVLKARPGVPLKPAGSAVKLVKKATERLEEDAKEMEGRLAQLRMDMLEEKKRRDAELPVKYGGSRWRSASEDRGSVSRYAQDVQNKAKAAGTAKGRSAAADNDGYDCAPTKAKKKKKKTMRDEAAERGGLRILSAATVSRWTTSQVLEWLTAIGLEEYQSGFEYHQITGAKLLEMTVDEYTQLGVTKLSMRNIMYTEIDKIRASVSSQDQRSRPVEIIDPKLRDVGPEAGSAASRAAIHWSHLTPLSEAALVASGTDVPVNLADGGFDEDASHTSFMKALLEWRASDDNEQVTSSVVTSGKATVELWVNPMAAVGEDDNSKSADFPVGGALLDGVYDEESEQEAFRRAVDAWRSGGSTESSAARQSVEQIEQGCTAASRQSCWQCYQVVNADSLLVDDQTGKAFCGAACRSVYRSEYARFYLKQ
ncbi:hypothetical protein PybrP1_004106 [[Pythium] brassicae (nom. inval.)]|nr:hypothetical protein PybrP1_004106 [[Pythium] brassicae (nom. inval.)]